MATQISRIARKRRSMVRQLRCPRTRKSSLIQPIIRMPLTFPPSPACARVRLSGQPVLSVVWRGPNGGVTVRKGMSLQRPALDRRPGLALYAAVEEAVEALIQERRLAPGDAIPPEQ